MLIDIICGIFAFIVGRIAYTLATLAATKWGLAGVAAAA